ncbi:PAS domain-containing sensor histidine kinase [Cytophaga aurantiaca]|uniref:PAS domain-containing sensor histidine kinase n=1 Tax=Cytophaga aurantiaca TaxID=29530 RepID=UPI00037B8DC7|nr:ATP-binding protein [Cytophaga aurantiaca]
MPNEIFTNEERQKLLKEIERLKAENARLLDVSQDAIYKAFFDACPDVIFKLDMDFNISFVHLPARSKEYIESISNKNIYDIIPNVFHASMQAGLQRSIQTGEPAFYESHGEFEGEEKYYENFLSPLKNKDGNVISIFFYCRNVTKQKLIEKSLIKNQHTLKTIFENSEHFITVISLDRKIIWFNKKSELLSPVVFGNKLELDCFAETFLPEKNRASFVEHFNHVLNGESINYVRQYTVDDAPFYLELFINPVYENAKITSVSLIGVDITKHKESEDYLKKVNVELTQQNEQLNEFSYIISHNLRGPISNLLGLVEIFKHHKEDATQTEQFLFHITKTTQKLDEVISDLNFVVTNHDSNVSNNSIVNLEDECSAIAGLLSVQIKKTEAKFKYDFSSCPEIYSVKSYIHNILYNLISNAIKYKREDCAPIVELSSCLVDKSTVCIECKDNGIGMDLKKYQDKLFGFYKRFHNHVDGRGIGLHLVKRQVELLDGYIKVESILEQGSIFKIYLPVKNADE